MRWDGLLAHIQARAEGQGWGRQGGAEGQAGFWLSWRLPRGRRCAPTAAMGTLPLQRPARPAACIRSATPWPAISACPIRSQQDEMRRTGCAVDARLLSYAVGIEHAKEAAALVVAEAAARVAAAGVAGSGAAARRQGLLAAQVAGAAAAGGLGRSGSLEEEAVDASDVPLPFGSPVMPALLPHGAQLPLIALEGGGSAAVGSEPADPSATAGTSREAATANGKAAAVAAQAAAGGAASQLGGLLRAHSSWLLFAAGWAAGAAGCALLLGSSRRAAAAARS